MNPIETRLSQALSETAEARDVDADRMRVELNDRLSTTPGAPPRRLLPVLAAAAAVVVVAGTVVGVRVLGGAEDDLATDGGVGRVATDFSCPSQVPVDLSGAQDEFLPDLSDRRPAEVAEEYGAPRWRFEDDGATARLLLANDDGSLGSITTYERADGEWKMVGSTVCGDGTPAAPTAETLRLGRHGGEPWPATGLLNPWGREAKPVFVDDRAVYDYSGLVTRHRSIYVEPCGRRLCWVTGDPRGGVVDRLAPDRLHDVSDLFFVPDDMVGRTNPLEVTAYWSPDGAGSRSSMTPFTDPSWDGGVLYVDVQPAAG
ncbi:MAG: hypothetical protein M3237_21380 [Actinomycetota bacterium]|nr:hypothetical protein [Actinomycetota bacterium]